MKKISFVALVAIAAVAFTSCNGKEKPTPTPDPEAEITITVSPKELMMSLDDQERLRATVTPAGTELTLRWKTTNDEVATVTSSGLVTAVGEGSAYIIVDAEGVKADSCAITVSDLAEIAGFGIEDYSVFIPSNLDYIEGTDSIFKLSFLDGKEFHCRLANWPVVMWDGNITVQSGWVGAGFVISASVPFYTIDDENAGEKNGTPFGWGSFRLADTGDKLYRNVGQAGKIINTNEYCQYLDSYITEIQKGDTADASNIRFDLFTANMVGAQVWYVDYTDPEDPFWSEDYGQVYGLVNDLNLTWNADVQDFTYTAEIKWLDYISEDRYFGMLVEKKADGTFGGVQPYDFQYITMKYSKEDAQEIVASTEPQPIKKLCKNLPPMPINRGFKVADKLYRK